ncbi:Rrn6p [Saccharomyces cerevisiae YJM683]|nr:Rrn6p [Saccharomyces cerevisiae YJM683]
MSEGQIPSSDVLGSQLGVGVQGASLYCPQENYTTKKQEKPQWLRPVDDTLAEDALDLHIVVKSLLCDTAIRYISDDKVLQESDADDDLITSDIDEDTDNQGDTSIVVNPVIPVVPKDVHFFKKVDIGNDSMFGVNCDTPVSFQDYIPSDLLRNLDDTLQESTNSSRPMQDAFFWDPTVANRLDSQYIQTASDLRNYRDGTEIIAYASGKTGSVLNIAVLTRQNTLHLNRHNNVTSIELHSPIKSIKIPGASESIGRRSNLVGIITENSFQIFRIESVHSRSCDVMVSSSEPLYFVEIDDLQVVDFAFNPWDLQQFAIIDIKGNWSIGRIPKNFNNNNKRKLQLIDNLHGTIFDPEELSSWKRIEWFSHFQKILVFDRSKMIEIDFMNNWQTEVVQAKAWSNIRDYKRIDDKNGILLTSREIIIVGASESNDPVRRISWKHDLDPDDTTLRITVQKVKKPDHILLVAFVYSMRHKRIYMHVFSHRKANLFQSLGCSTVLEIPGGTPTGIETILTLDHIDDESRREEDADENFELVVDFLVKLRNSSEVYYYALSNTQNSEPNKQETPIIVDHPEWASLFNNTDEREKESIGALVSQIKLKERERISRVQNLIEHENSHDEDKYLQDLGYRLSIATNELLESWQKTKDESILSGSLSHSKLKNLVENSDSFASIPEFSSLLDQFFQYYQDQDVTFIGFEKLLHLFLHEDVPGLDIFYNKLLQCWVLVSPQAELLTKEIVKDIIWSLARLEKPSLFEPIQNEISRSLSGPYQDIISSWDMDDINEEDESDEFNFDSQFSAPFNGRPPFNLNSQSQIPTIKSSQSSGLARRKRILKTQSQKATPLSQSTQNLSVLPDSMTPAFTLMQPPSSQISFVNDSQPRNSQKAKKKKKRIRGFG